MDLEQMVIDRVMGHGGTADQAEKLIALCDQLAARKGLNGDGLLMVLIDSLGPGATVEHALLQLKINAGEY